MTNARQQLIIAEALKWKGARYQHQASLPYIACDCIGIVIGVARTLGMLPSQYQPPPYSPEWHLHKHEQLLRDTMVEVGCMAVSLADRQPGNILLFQFGRACSHTAILVADNPDYIVHAVLHKSVLHQRLAGELLSRLRYCYAFPGVLA